MIIKINFNDNDYQELVENYLKRFNMNILYDLSMPLYEEKISASCVKAYENAQEKSNCILKSYDDKYLYDFTIDYINKQIPIDESHGRYPYITKEEIAKVLKCKPSDLDKTFMRLNREGILSQAKHRRMHDTARYGNLEETLSYDYGNSDWTPDAYDILAKAPVLTA